MNVYLIEKEPQRKAPEVFETLKQAVREIHPGSETVKNFSGESSEGSDQFLLRTPAGLIWGKVFYEVLSHADLDDLGKETSIFIRKLNNAQSFIRPPLLYIFFPSIAKGIADSLQAVPGRFIFFEYCFLQTRVCDENRQGLALRQWGEGEVSKSKNFFGKERGTSEKNLSMIDRGAYHFFKQARLSSDELKEFIELGLDLKKHSTA